MTTKINKIVSQADKVCKVSDIHVNFQRIATAMIKQHGFYAYTSVDAKTNQETKIVVL